jgi:hypothetical protein
MPSKTYRKKPSLTIAAVQLNLETEGFTYNKWGGVQTCKAQDWLVNNDGEAYTIDNESFRATYQEVSPGVYFKTGIVTAKVAEEDGSVDTKEGKTTYKAGDYIVYNSEDDAYAISAEKFNSLYEENTAEA